MIVSSELSWLMLLYFPFEGKACKIPSWIYGLVLGLFLHRDEIGDAFPWPLSNLSHCMLLGLLLLFLFFDKRCSLHVPEPGRNHWLPLLLTLIESKPMDYVVHKEGITPFVLVEALVQPGPGFVFTAQSIRTGCPLAGSWFFLSSGTSSFSKAHATSCHINWM